MICCTIVAYVQNYVNSVSIPYLIYLVKLVYFFHATGYLIESGK